MGKRPRSHRDLDEPYSKRRRTEPLQLSTLPNEVLLKILSDLPISTLSVCQRLSRQFYKLSSDSQIWKEKYYGRFVLPRALRIPGLRDPSTDPKRRLFSSKLSKWLDDEHLVKRGRETNWKRQYRLRHNWAHGSCKVNDVEVARRLGPPPLLRPLVKLYRGIIVTVDFIHGLRAWSMRDSCTLLAGIPLRSSPNLKKDIPTAIAIGAAAWPAKSTIIAVGYAAGYYDLYSFAPAHDRFALLYSTVDMGDNHNSSLDGVKDIAFADPYLATLSADKSLSLYVLDHDCNKSPAEVISSPKRLSVLKADNVGCDVSLSLRTSAHGVIASISHITKSITGDLILAIQELRLSSASDTVESRVASIDPGYPHLLSERSRVVPDPEDLLGSSTPFFTSAWRMPRAISYSHPYLLVTNKDNTMTLYLVDSTPDTLAIRPGRRLWGHTSGIASAQVSDRGKAVSVAKAGDEMRIWELEELVSSGPSRRFTKADVSTQVYPIRTESQEREKVVSLSEAIRCRGNGLKLALDEIEVGCSRWVGFDDEQVVVLKHRKMGTQILSCYDFR